MGRRARKRAAPFELLEIRPGEFVRSRADMPAEQVAAADELLDRKLAPALHGRHGSLHPVPQVQGLAEQEHYMTSFGASAAGLESEPRSLR